MSVPEQFEILHDETIELLDENKENILLRMLYISYYLENIKCIQIVLFDSKERIYSTPAHDTIADISSFHYLSNSMLSHTHRQAVHYIHQVITDNTYDIFIQCNNNRFILRILEYFINKQSEYYPTFGLSNFELK